MPTQSSKTSKSPSRYSVGMFSAGEARCDRWQDLAHAGQTLVAQSSSDSSTKETLATVEALLAPLSALETFRAYPGEAMMTALKDALGRRDYSSFSRITNRIAKAIITGSYRRSANAWIRSSNRSFPASSACGLPRRSKLVSQQELPRLGDVPEPGSARGPA